MAPSKKEKILSVALECVAVAFFVGPLGCSSHSDPLWGIQQNILGCLDGVLHQHGHGHGSHSSRDRGDVACLLPHT